MTTELWILEAQNQGEDMKDNYKQMIELLLDQNRLQIASNKRKEGINEHHIRLNKAEHYQERPHMIEQK